MIAAKNNTYSTLAQTAAIGDTSLLLTDASKFPSSGIAVLAGNVDPLINEVVFYAAKAGNALTGVLRGFDGTTEEVHVVGSMVGLALIAKHITDLQPKHGTSADRLALGLGLSVDDTGRRFYDTTLDTMFEWVNDRWVMATLSVGQQVRDYVGTPAAILPQSYRKCDRWTDTSSAKCILRMCITDTITHTLADWFTVGRQG